MMNLCHTQKSCPENCDLEKKIDAELRELKEEKKNERL